MPGTYTLTVLTEFSASHILRGHPGPCSRLHGHNWKVEVMVCGDYLEKNGLLLDFSVVKRVLRAVLDTMDHKFLNDLPDFHKMNPTSENIAKLIYQKISAHPDFKGNKVSQVGVWESENACAIYAE